MEFEVRQISNKWCKSWLLYRHYAKTIPLITFAYGLFSLDQEIMGVCTFGSTPCRKFNNGGEIFDNKLEINTLELNRLCVAEGLPKNSSSFFVAKCLSLLPKPVCILSYADAGVGHVGYIYQATNWIYTGLSEPQDYYVNIITGKRIHPRSVFNSYGTRNKDKIPEYIQRFKEEDSKHRYFKFLGSKKQIKDMLSKLKYSILPYPKGETKRHNEDVKIKTRGLLYKI